MNPNSSSAAPRVPLGELTPKKTLLASGVELHYVNGGCGNRLIFIHGAMGDWRSCEAQWDAFTARFECIAYSRRYSHPNANTMPSPHHSALDEAQDLAHFMDAIGWQQAILVGSSYGGFTALALAIALPQRVSAIVAIEPPMMKYAGFSAQGQEAARQFRAQVITPANAAFRADDDERAARIMTHGINGNASHANTPQAMERRLQNVRAMKMLALSSDEFPLLDPHALAQLPMPVMLVSGEQTEPLHRAIFDNICAAMPRARSLRIAGAGHGAARDQPQFFNHAALEFLNPFITGDKP